MSSKTRTRKTRSTNATTAPATLRAVPDQDPQSRTRTDAEHKLWEALRANPNSTTADLARTAKIGQSTAGKILPKWQEEGSVTRTPGIARGGRRAADLWTITDTDPTDRISDDDLGGDALAVTDAETAKRIDTDLATAGGGEPAVTGGMGERPEPLDGEATNPAVDAAADGSAVDRGDTGEDKEGPTARLAPGALRGMVEDYLRDHPDDEFGPTAIAHALGGKSSGAVNNALEKLVVSGTAVKTKDAPKRFALAPAAE